MDAFYDSYGGIVFFGGGGWKNVFSEIFTSLRNHKIVGKK